MTLREAAQQALEALTGVADWVNAYTQQHPWDQWQRVEPAIAALRAALAQQEQAEPVAQPVEPVPLTDCGRDASWYFSVIWPLLPIPGEYDSFDECDQNRWSNVIKQAIAQTIVGERSIHAKGAK